MSDMFVAEIRIFPFNFAPRGWAMCDGQLMTISQNTASFSLLGTNYGGDGRSNFAPHSRAGRRCSGNGPGLTPHVIGERPAHPQSLCRQQRCLAHSHVANADSSTGTSKSPAGNLPAVPAAVNARLLHQDVYDHGAQRVDARRKRIARRERFPAQQSAALSGAQFLHRSSGDIPRETMSLMKTNKSILFNRRGFLKCASLLGGAAAFDVWSLPRADAFPAARQWLTSILYLSDGGLVDARTLDSGDSSLMGSGVRVTIENYGLPDRISPRFRGFVAQFVVENGLESEPVPFYAWAPATPMKRSSFFMPVSPANGIMFSILTNDLQFPSELYYLALDRAARSAKLRTGMYVIASGSPGTSFAPKTENGAVRLVNTYGELPYFEHLLINVARAE